MKNLPKIEREMTTKEIILAYIELMNDEKMLKKVYRYVVMLWLME